MNKIKISVHYQDNHEPHPLHYFFPARRKSSTRLYLLGNHLWFVYFICVRFAPNNWFDTKFFLYGKFSDKYWE